MSFDDDVLVEGGLAEADPQLSLAEGKDAELTFIFGKGVPAHFKFVAGVDEVGRGPLAGPVVAGAVVFKRGYRNPRIKDSKQLTAEDREELVHVIKRAALGWAVAAVGPRRIDIINIREASRLAMLLALRKIASDVVLVDGNVPLKTRMPQRTVIGGDRRHVQISAASIIAKVWRDSLMRTLDAKYPGYGFCEHFGYGTPEHQDALRRLGPCRIHRRTFRGIREYFGFTEDAPPDLQTTLLPL